MVDVKFNEIIYEKLFEKGFAFLRHWPNCVPRCSYGDVLNPVIQNITVFRDGFLKVIKLKGDN